jgi:Fic family protein
VVFDQRRQLHPTGGIPTAGWGDQGNFGFATAGTITETVQAGQYTFGVTCAGIDPNQVVATAQANVTIAPSAMLTADSTSVTEGKPFTELFRDAAFPENGGSAATKEVARYRQALRVGFEAVRSSGLLTNNHILRIQLELEQNTAGFRKLPGTALKTSNGRVVYTPPQDPSVINDLMSDLERFINESERFSADPLIKMALIHHQFESIHPFYDGNGRTGRIINVLYLVKEGLLDIPVLYLSRYIVRRKSDYYRLLQSVRERDTWEEWVLYILTAVETVAREAIVTIQAIKTLLLDYKHRIRDRYRFYSQDLINNLFSHPYTKIEFIQTDLNVSRLTATKYLEALTADGFLEKRKVGRSNYYINERLYEILTGETG